MDINDTLQLASRYRQEGNLQQAEFIYKEILNFDPNNFHILNYLGNVLQDQRKFDEAIAYYQKAIKFNPLFAGSYFHLGSVFEIIGQSEKAINYYKKAIQYDPNFVGSYNNLGNVYRKLGRLDEAIPYFQRAIKVNPHFGGSYYNLGKVLQNKGQIDESIFYFQKTLQLNPSFAEAYCNLGDVLREKGRLDEAITNCQKALEIAPFFAEAYCTLGDVLREKGRLDEAISYYQKALQLNPYLDDAYNNLGISYREKRQFDKAMSCYQRALQLNPNRPHAYSNLGCIYQDKGQIDEAEIYFRLAIRIKQDSSTAYSNLLLSMLYNAHHDPRTIYLEHLNYSKKYAEYFAPTTYSHKNKRDPNRKMKIGYVSPDFRKHPVAYFIEPVIISHNREHFEIFCYSNSLKHDEVTKRVKEHADQWRNIVGMSDQKVAELIRKDGIDVLVDLAGHTANNRILVFARKPAPIQISWIGYLATTGLSTIDYKITDNYTDPPGKTDQFYTEKLMRLPESFLCYLPNRDSPDVGPLPALSTGHITFGSFNNFRKVTSEVFGLWARILNEIPGSRLILKGTSFYDKTTCEYAINMFTQRGIAAERILLQPPDPSPRHLASYNLVDIGLDTFPFNGATTTCEAMWMGVPVITLAGTAYHSSVGVSLLSNVGLKDLIAKTHDEYIRLAVNLANDINKLKILRSSLRDKMAYSPLTDAKRFTFHLESRYREIWRTWCQSV